MTDLRVPRRAVVGRLNLKIVLDRGCSGLRRVRGHYNQDRAHLGGGQRRELCDVHRCCVPESACHTMRGEPDP
ncbi:hypothetical protein [Micromonospora sp. CPCC 205558]|uniref:hypothetical protein n=1 Tax=Micromonospora sp. CPCC 205558 TaxID=3122403 RepID=UPI002FF0C05E